MTELSINQK